MLNVLHSSSNPSSTTTHSGHHKAPPEFCDYVPDLGQFGLETERSFRINEFYYSPQPDHQSGSSQNPPGGPQPPVEDYSEYFKGSYGCFNPEDLCDLVQSSQSTQPPNNGLISLGGVSSVPSQSLLQPVIAPSSSSTPAVLSHISTLMHDISGSMSFTDVSLRTHKGQELRVHASILASHSTFLRELLRCTPSEEGQLFLLLPDVEIYHLSMMIGFFYSGEVTLSQQKDLLPLRQLSHCLGVHSLIGRLDDLSLSLSNPYDGNPPILLQSLDSEELPHLSNSEIDSSIYLAPPQSTTSDGGRVPEAQGGRVKKKAFSCSRCSSKFYTHESLHVHESLHEEVKPFSCGVCGKSIASKAHLAVHMRIHSGEKPFACDACEKSFMDGSSLKRHKASHGDRVSHECEACGKVFGDRSTFKRHYKEKHVEGSKKYECHLCGKLFHRKETLNAHFVKVHSLSGEEIAQRDKAKEIEDSKKWKTFKCEVCGMMFSKQSTMEIHLRTHTGDKPYVCEVCGKKFTRSNNLKLHKRVHTGEKPYQCSQCDKRFSDVSAHKRHLRTHTGERPYECMQCGKGFIQIGAKNAHEKTCLLSSSKELESDNKKTTTSMLPSTVPGPLYVSQDASNYNPLVEDSSLVSLSNHSDLQPISI